MAVSNESISKILIGHRAYLAAYVWSFVRDEHLVEDVLQEVGALALGKAATINSERELLAWMRTACRLTSLAAVRKRSRHGMQLSPQALDALESAWDEQIPEADADRLDAMRICLGRLTPRSRAMLKLRYSDGLKPAQIAEREGRKPNSIYASMSRIISQLRKCIRHYLDQESATDSGGQR